jgi:hypothetical protein
MMASLSCPASAFETSAAEWPDIVGRWSATALPNGGKPTLPIAAVEIAPCGGTRLCGRLVETDGGCGPVMLRLTGAKSGTAFGDLAILAGAAPAPPLTEPATLVRLGEKLVIRSQNSRVSPLSRWTLPLIAHYLREGPPRCAPAVS